MERFSEFIDPYDAGTAPLFVRAEHLARYLWAAAYIRKCALPRVLDCACGNGYGCRALAASTQAVTGVDRDAARLEAARVLDRAAGAENTSYIEADLNLGLPMLRDAAFQCVTCFETLEHVERDGALLSEFRRVLTRGGRLLLSVPKSGYEPEDAQGKPENPHHLRLYEPEALKRLLKERGFIADKVLGQPYANAARVRVENYLRDSGKTHADIAAYFNETPASLEFIARVWAWPEADLREQSNTAVLICRKAP